jgi:fermentation-respiration switch protein FrsA (DUF1100 family)
MFRRSIIAAIVTLLLIPVGAWVLAGRLSAPAPAGVGNCPIDLACENVEFQSASGSTIKGWYVRGESGVGSVVLMHGLRSNRKALIDRIRFLRKDGFTVLAFDFQGSGESRGDQLTFGFLERLDAEAAVRFAREGRPDAKVGVIGISMGGAAFLLSGEMAHVDGLVLEMVYPTIERAIRNRLDKWMFNGARHLSPILTVQLGPRIGASADDLRPLDRISSFRSPVLLIAGESDPFTTLEESKQLFDAANEPKELWIVEGAGHEDLWKLRTVEYQKRVLEFLRRNINPPGGNDETIQSCNCLDDPDRRVRNAPEPGTNKD